MTDQQHTLPVNGAACVFIVGAGSYSDYGIIGVFGTDPEARAKGEAFIHAHNYSDDVQIECYVIGELEPIERHDWNDNEPERSWDWSRSRVVAKWKWDGEPNYRADNEYEGVAGHWEDVTHD